MDTLKMDEPIALRTRRKFKLQYPSEPRKDTILLDKTVNSIGSYVCESGRFDASDKLADPVTKMFIETRSSI